MKVLIISHNPITTYQNMGKTFLALFSGFSKEELCQLYIYPTIPDVDMCESYYRVTDRDVLCSYYKLGRVNSKVITEEEIDPNNHSFYESDKDANFYKKRKKNALSLLFRDTMWFFSRWYNNDLKSWLDEQKPTCIFLAPGESKFIYNIALKISKKLNISIFTYICDEYYFVNKSHSLIKNIQQLLLKRKMMETLKKSKCIVTICDELAKVYRNEFKTKTHTIFTASNYPIREVAINNTTKGITYMGNLSCNRFIAIADIGKALDKLNEEKKTNYSLFLYTPPIKTEIEKMFLDIKSIKLCGFVTGKEFEETLYSADILLHVEAFDKESIERVKHSISTKIADSLASGIPLFAYGPENVASMQHLIENKCAITVTSKNELEKTLYNTLIGANREEVVRNAFLVAKKYHSCKKNSETLHKILSEE